MSRKKIVAGNWKMNLTMQDALALVDCILKIETSSAVTKILFPPFPFIKELADKLKADSGFYVGAQNCHAQLSGAYTGEVSASMLASVCCSYVLVGHSERRLYFNETTKDFVAKIKSCLHNKITSIFCVGENLEQRKSNTHFEVVAMQLQEVLKSFSRAQFENILIAYEPVWAIGTGETATPHQAQEMHAHIRTIISNLYSKERAESTSILYGGSCNAKNAKELFSCPDVDGGLIGGASLKAEDFCTIINSF
jgi:triosephosphate isomerase (TIM)